MHILHESIAKALEIFFSLLGLIPRKWARRFGNVLGKLWYFADKKHRNVALTNLNYAYGQEKSPAEIEKLSRQVFENLAIIFWIECMVWDYVFWFDGFYKIL